MSEEILTQTPKKIKDELSPAQYKLILNLRRKGDTNSMLASEILIDSDESAAQVLQNFGCDILIPGFHYAPAGIVESFFGVTRDYIYQTLNKIGVKKVTTKDVLVTMTPVEFFQANRLLESGRLVHVTEENGKVRYTYELYGTEKSYEFLAAATGCVRFYSARAILIFSILYHSTKKGLESQAAAKIHSGIMKTPYGARVVARVESRIRPDQELEDIKEFVQEKTADQKTTPAQEDAEFLSMEELKAIIREAVAEAMAEANRKPKIKIVRTAT